MLENEMSLAVFNPHAAMVADLVKKNETQEFDHTTEQGEKDLRSWVHRIKGGCGDIEKARKGSKEGLLAMGKKIDDRAKELTAPLRSIQAERMKPLNDIDNAKRAAAEAIVEAEEAAKAEKAAAEQKELEEFRAKAQAVEDEQIAEVARQQQIVREKHIAEEVSQKAIHDANELAKKVAFDAAEVAKKAEREKQEAIDLERRVADEEAAKIRQEAEAKERQRLYEERAREMEAAKLAKIEAERASNKKHQTYIKDTAWTDLSYHIEDEKQARSLFDAIVAGKIRHISINY